MNDTHTQTTRRWIVSCLLLLSLTACSTLPLKRPEAPEVTLVSVDPQKIGLLEQQLLFTLRLSNPNDYSLPMQSLTFVASLDGKSVAKGSSNEELVLPANGDALLPLTVNASMTSMFSQMLKLATRSADSLNYDISGHLKLSNWPARIPFTVDGSVDKTVLD